MWLLQPAPPLLHPSSHGSTCQSVLCTSTTLRVRVVTRSGESTPLGWGQPAGESKEVPGPALRPGGRLGPWEWQRGCVPTHRLVSSTSGRPAHTPLGHSGWDREGGELVGLGS